MGDCFKLQGDVRHDAEYGKDRDDCAKGSRLAVTAGDKVRDTCDVLLFADPDYFTEQEPPGKGHQGRTQIDGKEIDAGRRRPANTAVECPGCAIDSQREGIDCRVVYDASAELALAVGVKGDTKEQSKIEQGGQNHQRDRNHGVSSSGPSCGSFLGLS